jgi:hypothetical protein
MGSETKVSLGDKGVSIPDDPLPVLCAKGSWNCSNMKEKYDAF